MDFTILSQASFVRQRDRLQADDVTGVPEAHQLHEIPEDRDDLGIAQIDTDVWFEEDHVQEQQVLQLSRLLGQSVVQTRQMLAELKRSGSDFSFDDFSRFAYHLQVNQRASVLAGMKQDEAFVLASLLAASDVVLPISYQDMMGRSVGLSIAEGIAQLSKDDLVGLYEAERFIDLMKKHLSGGRLGQFEQDFLLSFASKPIHAGLMHALNVKLSQGEDGLVAEPLGAELLIVQHLEQLSDRIDELWPMPSIEEVSKDPLSFVGQIRLPLPESWLRPDPADPQKPHLDLASAGLLIQLINMNNVEKELTFSSLIMKENIEKAQALTHIKEWLLDAAYRGEQHIPRSIVAKLFDAGIVAYPNLHTLAPTINKALQDPAQAEAAVYVYFGDAQGAQDWIQQHGGDASAALQALKDVHGGDTGLADWVTQQHITWSENPAVFDMQALKDQVMQDPKPIDPIFVNMHQEALQDHWTVLADSAQASASAYTSSDPARNIELQNILMRHQLSAEFATNFLSLFGKLLTNIIGKMS